jgi:hypothetical protein
MQFEAANLAAAHYLPISRAAQLMSDLAGVSVSAGWMAGVHAKAAGGLEPWDGPRGHPQAAGRRFIAKMTGPSAEITVKPRCR